MTRYLAMRATTAAFEDADAVVIEYVARSEDVDGDGLGRLIYDNVVCDDAELIRLVLAELRTMRPVRHFDQNDRGDKLEGMRWLRGKATRISPQRDGALGGTGCPYSGYRGGESRKKRSEPT